MSMDDNGSDNMSAGSMLLEDESEQSGYASDIDDNACRNSTGDYDLQSHHASSREQYGLEAHRMNDSPDISEGDSEDEDGNAFTIAFLQQKRRLLKRAADFMKREDVYDASIAKTAISLMSLEDPEIWIEAKHVLRVLASRDNGGTVANTCPHPLMSSSGCIPSSIKIDEPTAKKRKIDTSGVIRVQSVDYHPEAQSSIAGDDIKGGTPKTLYTDGPWMANALRQMECDSSSSDWSLTSPKESPSPITTRCKWEMQLDLNRGVYLSSEPLESPEAGCIKLEEALTITSVPQLLAQSSHPFSVVHANRAFFAGSGLSPSTVFGYNVETVLNAASVVATTQGYSCRIEVQPVCSRESITTHVLFQLVRENEEIVRTMANAFFAEEIGVNDTQGDTKHPSSLVETCG
jgi:hypothetical protein